MRFIGVYQWFCTIFFPLLRESDTDDGFLYLTTKRLMKVLVVLARHTEPEDSNQLQRGELTTVRRSTNALGSSKQSGRFKRRRVN